MKTLKSLFTSIFLITFLAVPSFAEEYEITPLYHGFSHHDGAMAPGSFLNPYVVTDSAGNEIGEIESLYPDINTDDGIMDPGSFSNPYVFETDDRD